MKDNEASMKGVIGVDPVSVALGVEEVEHADGRRPCQEVPIETDAVTGELEEIACAPGADSPGPA